MGGVGTNREAGGARRDQRAKHLLLVTGKTAVSIGLLWALFANYDFTGTLSRIAGIDPAIFLLVVAGMFLSIVMVTLRWVIVLRALGIAPGFSPALGIVFIGLFFNQVLPSNLGGDAMRVWRLFRTGSALGRAVGSVMLDRVIAIVALTLLVAGGLLANPGLITDPPMLSALWAAVALVAVGLGALLVFDRLLAPLRRFMPDRLVGAGAGLARDARAALLEIRYGAPVMGISVVNHAFTVALVCALAVGLGIEVDFGAMVALVPPVILVSMMPVSFAGWGVREGAMIAALAYAGVPADGALALSVAFGLTVLIAALPGAAIWFVTGNRMRAQER